MDCDDCVEKLYAFLDTRHVDDNQAGVNSLAYRPGPYSKTESGLTRFTLWYLAQIAKNGS